MKKCCEETFKQADDDIQCKCRLDIRAHELTFNTSIDALWARLKALEEWKDASIKKNIEDVKRIRDLEQTILDSMRGKIPHKCPVCDGKGEIKFYWIADKDYQTVLKGESCQKITSCNACEGKGIVWG